MTRLRRIWLAMALVVLALVASLSIWHGLRAAWSDASALHARWVVNEWRDGNGAVFTPILWEQTRDELLAALQTAPGNAQLLDDLGFLYAARGQSLGAPAVGSEELVLQQNLLTSAIDSYRQAADLRPTFPYSWAYLALAKHLRHQYDAEFWASFDKALHYGRNEAGVQPALAQVAFAQWSRLGSGRQKEIAIMVATAHEISRQRLLEMAMQSGVTLPGL